jgi:enamine deaminase RidA (YjgF/YER057c/UK114 family)
VPSYVINPPELKDARDIGYNHARIDDGTFYMAGQVAMDADSNVVGDDIETQARKAYENIGILLDTIDKTYSDIAKVTTHIVDPAEHYYDGYKEVYWETFSEPYPCHTVLGHEQLANEDYLVEIEVEVPLSAADIEGIEPDGDVVRDLDA